MNPAGFGLGKLFLKTKQIPAIHLGEGEAAQSWEGVGFKIHLSELLGSDATSDALPRTLHHPALPPPQQKLLDALLSQEHPASRR